MYFASFPPQSQNGLKTKVHIISLMGAKLFIPVHFSVGVLCGGRAESYGGQYLFIIVVQAECDNSVNKLGTVDTV